MAMLTWDHFLIPVLRVLSNGEVRRRKYVKQCALDDRGE